MKRCPSLAKCREGGAAEREVTCGRLPRRFRRRAGPMTSGPG